MILFHPNSNQVTFSTSKSSKCVVNHLSQSYTIYDILRCPSGTLMEQRALGWASDLIPLDFHFLISKWGDWHRILSTVFLSLSEILTTKSIPPDFQTSPFSFQTSTPAVLRSTRPWMVCPTYPVVQGSGHNRQVPSLTTLCPQVHTKDRQADGSYPWSLYFGSIFTEAPAIKWVLQISKESHKPQNMNRFCSYSQEPTKSLGESEWLRI